MKEEVLSKIIEFMKDDDDLDENDPWDHFTEEQIDQRLSKLDGIQAAIEKEISDYSLEKAKDILQLEEEKDIYRIMLFGKGLENYIVVFFSESKIKAYDLDTPNELLARLFNVTVLLVP